MFFRDDDTVIPIKWFEVTDANPCINMDTAIGRWYNGPHAEIEWPVGETIDNSRKFELAPPTHTGVEGKFCGTPTDFSRGGLSHTSDPPLKFNALGMSCCCLPPLKVIPLSSNQFWFSAMLFSDPFAASCLIPYCTPNHLKAVDIGLQWASFAAPHTTCGFGWSIGTAPGLSDIAAGSFFGEIKLVGAIPFGPYKLYTARVPLELDVNQSEAYLTLRHFTASDVLSTGWWCPSALASSQGYRSFDGIHFTAFYPASVSFVF